MPTFTTQARRVARGIQRELWPSAEEAVLKRLEREARRHPRHTHGAIAVSSYRLEYADAASVWPQWEDIFIKRTMAFETTSASPRILDCGANVGVASLYFKHQYPKARVTAFEADQDLAAICRRNVAANRANDVDVLAAAVWTATGELEFICEGSDSGAIASLDAGVQGRSVIVPAIRLRDWLSEPVDLLKLDIEGAELAVLQDCGDALRNVKSISIDLHEFDPARRQTGPLFALLTDAGFTFDLHGLTPLPWRSPKVHAPFDRPAPVWAVMVRAWRA